MINLFKCFDENCSGTVKKTTINYEIELSFGDVITINNLPVEKCECCGELLFPSNSCKAIESAIEAKYPNYFKQQ